MRAFVIGTVLTLLVVLGAGVVVHGQRIQAKTPELVGTWHIRDRDGGQPFQLFMLNSDGTAMVTDTRGSVHLGAWEVREDGTFAANLVTLADRGGPQGFTMEFPITEEADGTFIIGEYRFARVTPPRSTD
jgi:hypothetical protein